MGLKTIFIKLSLLYAAVFVVSLVPYFLGWDMFVYERLATGVMVVGTATIAFYEGLKK